MKNIAVSLNNEAKTLAAETTVAQALALWGFENSKIAVAINTQFVPRSQYAQRIIQAGDQLDVLAPVQGG